MFLCTVNIAFEFINYHWNSKGRHGIHSPFIFEMIEKTFQLKMNNEEKQNINKLFSELSTNTTTLKIQDFGAGSHRLGKERKIADIFKTSSSKGKFGRLLFQLMRSYDLKNALEFGTSLGVGSYHLHLGNPNAQITTIEACPETAAFSRKNLGNRTKNIRFIESTFNDYLAKNEINQFDLIYVDGHHDGSALLEYMEKLEVYSHNDTFFLLDDIRWSNSMFDAWNKLRLSDKFHVSIDLFRMGILVPRNQQQKEHFVLKYS